MLIRREPGGDAALGTEDGGGGKHLRKKSEVEIRMRQQNMQLIRFTNDEAAAEMRSGAIGLVGRRGNS